MGLFDITRKQYQLGRTGVTELRSTCWAFESPGASEHLDQTTYRWSDPRAARLIGRALVQSPPGEYNLVIPDLADEARIRNAINGAQNSVDLWPLAPFAAGVALLLAEAGCAALARQGTNVAPVYHFLDTLNRKLYEGRLLVGTPFVAHMFRQWRQADMAEAAVPQVSINGVPLLTYSQVLIQRQLGGGA